MGKANTCNLGKEAVPNELLDLLRRSPDRILKVSFYCFYNNMWEEGNELKKELSNSKAEFRGNLEGSGPTNFLTFHLFIQ